MCFDNIGSTLSPDQGYSFEGELTLSELTSSVNSWNLNRSPGLDGLTVEFYRHFWHLLGTLLLRVTCKCLRQGFLSNSMKGSITRLISRKEAIRKTLKIDDLSLCSMWIIRLYPRLLHLVYRAFFSILFIPTKLALFPVDVFFLTFFKCGMF